MFLSIYIIYNSCVVFSLQLSIVMASIQSWKVTQLYILLLVSLLGELYSCTL